MKLWEWGDLNLSLGIQPGTRPTHNGSSLFFHIHSPQFSILKLFWPIFKIYFPDIQNKIEAPSPRLSLMDVNPWTFNQLWLTPLHHHHHHNSQITNWSTPRRSLLVIEGPPKSNPKDKPKIVSVYRSNLFQEIPGCGI